MRGEEDRDNTYNAKLECHAATHYYYLTTREFKYKEQKTGDVRVYVTVMSPVRRLAELGICGDNYVLRAVTISCYCYFLLSLFVKK